MPKLIVVSNRLPVSLSTTGELTRSSGGLVSALSSLSTPFLWVGSLGSGGGVDEAAKASLAASGCLAALGGALGAQPGALALACVHGALLAWAVAGGGGCRRRGAGAGAAAAAAAESAAASFRLAHAAKEAFAAWSEGMRSAVYRAVRRLRDHPSKQRQLQQQQRQQQQRQL